MATLSYNLVPGFVLSIYIRLLIIIYSTFSFCLNSWLGGTCQLSRDSTALSCLFYLDCSASGLGFELGLWCKWQWQWQWLFTRWTDHLAVVGAQMMYRVFCEESPPTTIKPKQLVVISYDAPCVALTSTWSKPIVNVLKYCKGFSQNIFFYWKMSPVANEIIPFLEGIFPFYKYTNPLFMTFFKVPGLHSNIMKQPTLY